MSPTVSTSDTPPTKKIPGVMASWPASLSNFCKLVEEASFGKDYDSSIRYGLRLKKDESEILGLDRFMEALEQIDDDIKAEKEKQAELDRQRDSATTPADGDGNERDDTCGATEEDDKEDASLQALVENPDKLDDESKEELVRHQLAAQRYCSVLRLGPEAKNATALGTEISDWLGYLKGDSGTLEGLTVVWYNTPMVGE